MDDSQIRQHVRERYAGFAASSSPCCGPAPSSCGCSPSPAAGVSPSGSERIGYESEDLAAIPAEADLGLGCGNPTGLADLTLGETVLDLGSGGGIDCFLAARAVGPQGRVIGVDMTPEMLDRARTAAASGGWDNVEFRLGEIENLPVADGSVDAIISNCVVNLSPDKPRVFREAHRVLQSGGRITVSDIVLAQDLPTPLLESVDAYVGCIAGAMLRDEYIDAIRQAGFGDVEIVSERPFDIDLDDWPAMGVDRETLESAMEHVLSITVKAVK
jgi:SAM-dependent methyltransferase